MKTFRQQFSLGVKTICSESVIKISERCKNYIRTEFMSNLTFQSDLLNALSIHYFYIQLASIIHNDEGEVSSVPDLYPDCTCQVYSPRVG